MEPRRVCEQCERRLRSRMCRRRSQKKDGSAKPAPNPELEKRLAELRELLRNQEITDEICKKRVLELLREYS